MGEVTTPVHTFLSAVGKLTSGSLVAMDGGVGGGGGGSVGGGSEGKKKDYNLRKRVDLVSGISLIVGTMIGISSMLAVLAFSKILVV